MKRGIILLLAIFFSFALVSAAAETCEPEIALLNQDPYPAVPGDYVKIVFQVEGLEKQDCGDISFELIEAYPIILKAGDSGIRTFSKVNYIKDFESNLLIPYEVIVDENAIDGANPIEVRLKNKKGTRTLLKTFDIEIDDPRANFEIYVTDYDYASREMTIEVLNIAEADIEALTIEIPKQEALGIKGSPRVVVGDLDSNEYTSADFEAYPKDSEFIARLHYSDSINVRRTVVMGVSFDSSYFTERIADQKESSKTSYIIYAVIIILIIWWFWSRRKKKKEREKRRLEREKQNKK